MKSLGAQSDDLTFVDNKLKTCQINDKSLTVQTNHNFSFVKPIALIILEK